MTRFGLVLALSILLLMIPAQVVAAPVMNISVPVGLSIAEIKMTGDEFIVLQNNTGETIPNLASYWLYNFNNANPVASGVSSSSQQLPSGPLYAGETALMSAAGMATCGAAMAGRLSFSLTDSGGFLQVAQTQLVNNTVVQQVSDTVSWSSGAQGTIQNVPTSTKAPNALWYRYQDTANPDSYPWQQAALNAEDSCTYDVAVAGATQPVDASSLLAPQSAPPVTLLTVDSGVDGSAAAVPVMPAANRGLQAPILNELLPNPASPLSDETDEFIELYNPNAAPFDLSGFFLQSASATGASSKTFTFPAGTMLPPKSFVAFMSEQTRLSMSNSGGQVWLLDPFTGIIGQTMSYGAAKDGQAWALGSGKWSWSSEQTPSRANVIKTPVAAAKKTSAKSKTAASKKTAQKVNAANSAKTAAVKSPGLLDEVAGEGKVHVYVLATVGGLAVLYAGYEYRHDIRNLIYKLRRHRETRSFSR